MKTKPMYRIKIITKRISSRDEFGMQCTATSEVFMPQKFQWWWPFWTDMDYFPTFRKEFAIRRIEKDRARFQKKNVDVRYEQA